ncbi:MAG: hypothetical protein ACRDA3_13120 [Peptostreptococcaceae bacterium]
MLRPVDKLGRVSIPREWMKNIEKSMEGSDRKFVLMYYDYEKNVVTIAEPKEIFKCAFCGETDDLKLHFFKDGCICINCKKIISKR